MNCWEYKKCGREAGGFKSEEFGICPVFLEDSVNGINNGKNGGRCCWVVAGSFCGGKIQGTFADKVTNCLFCDFYKLVWKEEQEKGYKTPVEILKILKEKKDENNTEQ
jgi:hypothetical protein